VLHAFFKALLFLSAGVIIHSLNDEQDIRRMGGLIQFMPFTYAVMLIGTIALLGLPWLSGFYSKDLILELAYGHYQFSSIFAFILGTLTAFLTAFYSFRLISFVYFTVPNANKTSYFNIHSENNVVLIPLSLLALFAIFLGFIASDFGGIGSDFFGNSLFYHPTQLHIIEAEFSLPLYIKLMATILSIFGGSLAIYLYHYGYRFFTDFTFPFLTQEKVVYNLGSVKFGTTSEVSSQRQVNKQPARGLDTDLALPAKGVKGAAVSQPDLPSVGVGELLTASRFAIVKES
jgi:NADH-ubiquinone oxidoreductase chain 5